MEGITVDIDASVIVLTSPSGEAFAVERNALRMERAAAVSMNSGGLREFAITYAQTHMR